MSTPEKLEPGDNVEVSSCKKRTPFCEVSPAIVDMQEAGDNRIPLKTPSCECVQSPNQVKKIPSELP